MNDRFAHKKSLGQHFLNSAYVPQQMCEAADVNGADVVVEIGPGTGVLTKEILAREATVIALEADERAVAILRDTFASEIANKQLVLHHVDVRSFDIASLDLTPASYKVVANIPYYLSGRLFRTFLDTSCQPSTLVYLVQKEVAVRIARDPKESLLSLSVKVFGTPQYVTTVKRTHFTPPPQVDSAIVAVRDISLEFFNNFSRADFFSILHLAFKSKRKQLQGNLQPVFSREDIAAAMTAAGLSPTARAEDVSPPQWKTLVMHLLSTR